jgi:O-antigen/teichoic acid export membrane protein
MRAFYNLLANQIENRFRIDAHYFLSGGFWLLIAQASTVLSSLLVAVFFAKILPESDYGIYRYIVGLAALISAFSLTGIGQAILQASSQGYEYFIKESIPITLKWSLGITISSLLGSAYYFLQDNNLLSISCVLIAFLHPVSQFFQNTLSYLYGKTKFKTGAMMQIIKSVFVSITSLISIFLTNDILTLLAIYFSSQAISAIFCHLIYYSNKTTSSKTPPEIFGKYINYAKHSSYRNALGLIAIRLDTVLVFQLLGAKELALFSIATLLPEHISGSFKNLQTLLLPKYAKHESINTIKTTIPRRSFHFLLLLIVFTAIFIIIIPFVYTLLFPKYIDAIPYVQLLALSFPSSVFLIPLGAIQSQRMEKELYIYNVVTSLIQIVSLLILIFVFGLLGAIISRILTQYSRTLIAYMLLYKNKTT